MKKSQCRFRDCIHIWKASIVLKLTSTVALIRHHVFIEDVCCCCYCCLCWFVQRTVCRWAPNLAVASVLTRSCICVLTTQLQCQPDQYWIIAGKQSRDHPAMTKRKRIRRGLWSLYQQEGFLKHYCNDQIFSASVPFTKPLSCDIYHSENYQDQYRSAHPEGAPARCGATEEPYVSKACFICCSPMQKTESE